MSNIISFPKVQKPLDIQEDYTWRQLFFSDFSDTCTVKIEYIYWESEEGHHFVPMATVEHYDIQTIFYLNDPETDMFHFETMINYFGHSDPSYECFMEVKNNIGIRLAGGNKFEFTGIFDE